MAAVVDAKKELPGGEHFATVPRVTLFKLDWSSGSVDRVEATGKEPWVRGTRAADGHTAGTSSSAGSLQGWWAAAGAALPTSPSGS